MREGNYRFYENGVYVGYNPWNESMIFESSNYLTFLDFSFGESISYADGLVNRSWAFVARPEAGLNMNFFQVYYGYSLMWSNDQSYWETPHNIGLSISIASTTAFYKGSKYEQIHWGGI